MEFSFALAGTGWADARVSDDESHIMLPASYLSDCLGELLQAVGVLLEGGARAECSWEEEPGEYRWVFNRIDDQVSLTILDFPDSWPRRPDVEGTAVFTTTGRVHDVAVAIVDGASAVLDRYGEEEYKRQWVRYPFPTELLGHVRERLAGFE